MKHKGIITLLIVALLMPGFVFAKDSNEVLEDDDFVVVAETHKYYKTVTTIDIDQFTNIGKMGSALSNGLSSVTYEVTEEEYNTAKEEDRIVRGNPAVVETTYKHMISSISANGSYYRYKNILSWKLIPSVRSYDIIAIGFLGTVKPKTLPSFVENYCRPNGYCSTITMDTVQIFTYGAGTSFALPTGELSSLKQTFWFDVEKNTTNTVTIQKAYGDYAHATSTVGMIDATNYTVSQSAGIVLGSSISSSYDSIPVADATWYGSW